MPPMMPPTWNTSATYISSQSHSTHDTRQRGPGSVSSAASVDWLVAIAVRASSICTNTFSAQPRTMNQSSVKPTDAPSLGVTISSPDPTMVAVMMKPGPKMTKATRQMTREEPSSSGCPGSQVAGVERVGQVDRADRVTRRRA